MNWLRTRIDPLFDKLSTKLSHVTLFHFQLVQAIYCK